MYLEEFAIKLLSSLAKSVERSKEDIWWLDDSCLFVLLKLRRVLLALFENIVVVSLSEWNFKQRIEAKLSYQKSCNLLLDFATILYLYLSLSLSFSLSLINLT